MVQLVYGQVLKICQRKLLKRILVFPECFSLYSSDFSVGFILFFKKKERVAIHKYCFQTQIKVLKCIILFFFFGRKLIDEWTNIGAS